MLEVRNLTKIYKAKGGAEIRALDDVSLSFGETGLVFVLGKSGCGKSTLLNMIGCLDSPTSGEIIADGRSIRDFSSADLDAYRNTFVGFIFQEYNVLNEFTVKDNVSLALELQREKNADERVHEILQELELEEFADRKPGTLSGGQKQRVAIARALVKNPRIIMADEPTGALDSNTGKQVLDTLKYLSGTRLVIVVSHDRDFAESYGDRIIELKDGRVISDVTKVHEQAEIINDSVKQIGPNILTVKSGARLTRENFAAIQAFISSRRDTVMIAAGNEDAAIVRKVVKVSEEDTRESFVDTPSEGSEIAGAKRPAEAASKPQAEASGAGAGADAGADAGAGAGADAGADAGEKAKAAGFRVAADEMKTDMVRPRLPFKKAFKMGATGLGIKRFRLAITIILSIVAFVFFGLMACFMTYNVNDIFADSFLASNYTCLNLQKNYKYTEIITHYKNGEKDSTDKWTGTIQTNFSEDDVSDFGLSAGDALFGCAVPGNVWNASISVSSEDYAYYKISINKALYAPEESAYHKTKAEGGAILYGSYPKEDNEACISSYMAEALLHSEFYDYADGKTNAPEYDVSVMEDLIGTVLYVNDSYDYSGTSYENSSAAFEITGIFDAGGMPDEYLSIRDGTYDSNTASDFTYYLQDGLEQCLLVTQNYFSSKEVVNEYPAEYYFNQSYSYMVSFSKDPYGNPGDLYYENDYMYYSEDSLDVNFFDGQARTSLADDEVAVPLSYLMNIASCDFDSVHSGDENYEEEYEDFQTAALSSDGVDIGVYPALQGLRDGFFRYYEPLSDGSRISGTMYVETDEVREFLEGIVTDYFAQNPAIITIFSQTGVSRDTDLAGSLKVAGWYDSSDIGNAGLYLSKAVYDKLDLDWSFVWSYDYEFPEDAYYECMVIPITRTSSWLGSVIHRMDGSTVSYTSTNRLYDIVSTVGGLLETLSAVFLGVGIVLAIFAALLLFNFISVSISGKNKEIGILRAVGASGKDVFKIFFTESAIISLICFVLSVIVCAVLVMFFDSYFRASFYTVVTLIVFNGWCVLMMLAIAVIVAFLGTFLPVFFAARRKPAEAIRTL
ncbi:MAG: ABC transporter ATP-binding protein/permease [Clostridia bacterium]|nr:ABC transporter ATP-binding protein/permease [Clostridia bacterium]